MSDSRIGRKGGRKGVDRQWMMANKALVCNVDDAVVARDVATPFLLFCWHSARICGPLALMRCFCVFLFVLCVLECGFEAWGAQVLVVSATRGA